MILTFKAKHSIAALEWVKLISSLTPKQLLIKEEFNDFGYQYATSIEGKIVLKIGDSDNKYTVKGRQCLIGRNRGNDLVLEGKYVSRFHCKIAIHKNVPYIIDFGSDRGTFLNGQLVLKFPLAPKDKIKVGKSVIVFDGKIICEIYSKHSNETIVKGEDSIFNRPDSD